MKIKNRYSPIDRPTLTFLKPTKTDTSQKAACDINNIMKKYAKTGVITHVTSAVPQFGDISHLGDYQASLNQIRHAEDLFEQLPSRVRERFKNNPADFMTFMSNSKNYEEAVTLGLAIRKPETTPDPVPTPNPLPLKTQQPKNAQTKTNDD